MPADVANKRACHCLVMYKSTSFAFSSCRPEQLGCQIVCMKWYYRFRHQVYPRPIRSFAMHIRSDLSIFSLSTDLHTQNLNQRLVCMMLGFIRITGSRILELKRYILPKVPCLSSSMEENFRRMLFVCCKPSRNQNHGTRAGGGRKLDLKISILYLRLVPHYYEIISPNIGQTSSSLKITVKTAKSYCDHVSHSSTL